MFMTKNRVLVALATYNERDNLAPLVREIRRTLPAADVLIMDDHSPDGTGVTADQLAAQDQQIRVIHRPGKLGLGTAILSLMRYALDLRYDYLITMDADFSHQPAYLPELLRKMEQADIMIGSRYVSGGGIVNWPLSRRLMSRCTNHLVRLLTGVPVHDMSGNYRCYRVSLLRRANLNHIRSQGYSFLQEILHRCYLAGARFREIPIVFADRRAGQSKVNLSEMVSSMSMLLLLGWRARFHKKSMMPTDAPQNADGGSDRQAA